NWALVGIAIAQAKAGEAKEAFATLKMIKDAGLLEVALRDLAIAQADAGYIKEAQDTLKMIKNVHDRASVLSSIKAGANKKR
ncbi:MAG: hypothetical protein HN809_07755, partial [Rhodospirillaceae bacterium]|nr:hypothetical protein [Rhodospirillaceae bacterium]